MYGVLTLQFVTVKFLGTRDEDAERMGVACVQLSGHHYTEASQKSLSFLKKLVCVCVCAPYMESHLLLLKWLRP